MQLNGKTVCFLGDSITEGCGASSKDKCFVSLFAAAHPEATVHNFGIGGTRIAKQGTPTVDHPRYDLDFVSRVSDMPENADLICVFGGTNDYGHGDAPMGSWGCKTNDTFFGALYTLSLDLINKYPTARIVFFTPLYRDKIAPTLRADGYWTLDQYVDAIRQNAAYFSFPVLDLRNESGIQPQVPILKEKYTKDGLHPNDAGYEKIFRMVDKFIANLE